jgi:hypothetical protein
MSYYVTNLAQQFYILFYIPEKLAVLLYKYKGNGRLRHPTPNYQKTHLLLLFSTSSFSNPYYPTHLSTRYDRILCGLADPRTPHHAFFLGGRSWVYRVKNERLIGLVNLLVGLAIWIHRDSRRSGRRRLSS